MRSCLRARVLLSLSLLGACAAPGCRRTTPPPATAITATTRMVDHKLVGVVRQVNAKAGQVMIRHEAIPGFMDAMTMPFTLKDRAVLDDLAPGDEVEGTLRVAMKGELVEDYSLDDLHVTRPAIAAPPEKLTLSLAGGTPEIKPTPKLLAPGDAVPDFAFTTQDGRRERLSDLRGHVVVLTFIYTRCPLPDFCPRLDRKFSELAGAIGAFPDRARAVRLVSISFDPEHDTPEVLRKHARTQGALPPLWTFAVAPHDELAKVAGPLGLAYGPMRDEIAHNLSTAVIDPRGRLVRLETGATGKTWTPIELLKTIYSLIPRSDG